MAQILVVEGDPGVRSYLVDALELADHRCEPISEAGQALHRLEADSFDVMLLDLASLPPQSGWDVLDHGLAHQPDLQIIVLVAYGNEQARLEAKRRGAFDALRKPISEPGELRLVVERAWTWREMVAERSRIRDNLPNVTVCADSEAMQALLEEASHQSESAGPLWICGEADSGKQMIARLIHHSGEAASAPFVVATPDEELFEPERGAVHRARGGTLYLHSAGAISQEVQRELIVGLRRGLGCRLVMGSHLRLSQMRRTAALEPALLEMLANAELKVPPLRKRRADIVPLAELLLGEISAKLGKQEVTLSLAASRALMRASWPGNVRELRNALERALMFCGEARELKPDHFALMGASREISTLQETPSTLRDIERRALIDALRECGDDLGEAAQRLGIAVEVLQEKLVQHQLA